jgi:bifunctional UDP-N-acetylglucosamine pyrophosphorylase/glucosamine-1-phosphate N-acetyltransferase
MNKKIQIVILAGGKGKRMNGGDLPKILVPLSGKHLISHLLETVQTLTTEKPIAVIGHQAELVKEKLGGSCIYALQKEQLGTAHALACAEEAAGDAEHILMLQGDMPFMTKETMQELAARHLDSEAKITLATTELSDYEDWRSAFINFGRILRKDGQVVGIREYKDASEEEKSIKEVNAGSYVFDAKWLWQNLKKIKNENAQKEYYLTDLLRLAFEEKEKIEVVKIDPREALGANSKEELEILERFA